MTWRAIAEQVSTRTETPYATTRAVLDVLLEEVAARLAFGEPVSLPGIGVLDGRWAPERVVRSVHDGRKVAIDARYQPTFRPSAHLREVLRSRSPQMLQDPAHQRAWRLAEAVIGDLALYHEQDAPRDLKGDTDLATVNARCARSLGDAWTRARRTHDDQTSPAVREARDHLALAARRRWADAD
ncbi:MAG: HU family DNA-binding protein [Pseudomonadota bacterium]|nr:HU family DNA-binding protein [Pseudomonadota bacterium]